MQPTPYSTRLAISREFGRESVPIPANRCVGHASNPIVRSILVSDVNAVMAYRETADPMNEETATAWFPRTDSRVVLQTVDADRDFIYTAAGLRLLTNRYLFEREPIQFGMLRIAMNLARREPELTKIVYDLLSCGFIHVSSIVAAADHVRSEAIKPGEACRLLVAKDGYDHELVSQIERISELISLGVGVGYGVSNLPLAGKTKRGLIRSGFMSLVERLNAANYISLHERKPKIALYLHAHNDTVNLALTIKKPSRINKINNVFIGLMIPNHFMECVRRDLDWYLFPGDLTLDGKNLADFTGARYVEEYERRVALELHTRKCRARDLMYEILQSLVETGSPYIIWSDHLNEFNNHKAHGTIKTLNLCAEITNYSDSENDSSCTLLSCNMAMYRDFPLVMDSLEERMGRLFGARCPAREFEHPELARHAYIVGYYGAVILNAFMGPTRERREIGLNPLGVYDMALMAESEPSAVCATVSEALYRGGVTASCDEYERTGVLCKMYPGSMFSLGRPQFSLRGVKPRSDWSSLVERMRLGMANSMLTSQAPTATTAMLTGVTESVLIPISHFVAKESENGRNDFIPYGVMCRTMNASSIDELEHRGDLETQLSMYTASAPYVDHSQSVMISLNTNTAEIYRAIIATYKANLKTVMIQKRVPIGTDRKRRERPIGANFLRLASSPKEIVGMVCHKHLSGWALVGLNVDNQPVKVWTTINGFEPFRGIGVESAKIRDIVRRCRPRTLYLNDAHVLAPMKSLGREIRVIAYSGSLESLLTELSSSVVESIDAGGAAPKNIESAPTFAEIRELTGNAITYKEYVAIYGTA